MSFCKSFYPVDLYPHKVNNVEMGIQQGLEILENVNNSSSEMLLAKIHNKNISSVLLSVFENFETDRNSFLFGSFRLSY